MKASRIALVSTLLALSLASVSARAWEWAGDDPYWRGAQQRAQKETFIGTAGKPDAKQSRAAPYGGVRNYDLMDRYNP